MNSTDTTKSTTHQTKASGLTGALMPAKDDICPLVLAFWRLLSSCAWPLQHEHVPCLPVVTCPGLAGHGLPFKVHLFPAI